MLSELKATVSATEERYENQLKDIDKRIRKIHRQIENKNNQIEKLEETKHKIEKRESAWIGCFVPSLIKAIEEKTGLICTNYGYFLNDNRLFVLLSERGKNYAECHPKYKGVMLALYDKTYEYESQMVINPYPKTDIRSALIRRRPLPEDIDDIIEILTGDREILPERYQKKEKTNEK